MINQETYTIEWLNEVSAQNRNAEKILIEKTIHALTLLTQLKEAGLDFIFKGGTALMLVFDKPGRLSIDIDIIIQDKKVDLGSVFGMIVEKGHFSRYQEQNRFVESYIEKAHYKFFYKPILKTHIDEEYILLDILFENNPYVLLIETLVKSDFLKTDSHPISVLTPSFEDILGDKLTAFAPNTTGIPYYKGKKSMSMEIMKQLYNIGNLIDKVSDIENIRRTFNNIASKELLYRKQESKTLSLRTVITTN